jgi:hypothetical protein
MEEKSMDKYLRNSVEFARGIGKINTVNMTEANKWFPPTIELTGKTAEGDPFLVTICVGDKLPDEEKEEAENA